MAYEKTLWKTGDIVTEEKMNKIEQGIKSMELPAVTSEDDGKVLAVSNGEWALGNASSGSGIFIIPITAHQTGFGESGRVIFEATTNKTWSEIYDAYTNGQLLVSKVFVTDYNHTHIAPVCYYSADEGFNFNSINCTPNSLGVQISAINVMRTIITEDAEVTNKAFVELDSFDKYFT